MHMGLQNGTLMGFRKESTSEIPGFLFIFEGIRKKVCSQSSPWGLFELGKYRKLQGREVLRSFRYLSYRKGNDGRAKEGIDCSRSSGKAIIIKSKG